MPDWGDVRQGVINGLGLRGVERRREQTGGQKR